MTRLQKMILQISLYGAAILYICADLFLFNGPIARKIASKAPPSSGLVAQVFNHPITRGQVERAARELMWRSGKDYDALDPAARKLARYAALDELIDHELLRIKAMHHAKEARVDEQQLDARIERFNRRFRDKASRLEAMKSQGIGDDQELRERMAAHIQQENYVALKIDPLVEVSDEEAREWFDQHRDSLALPPVVRARHIFLPSLEFSDEEARSKLLTAKQQLEQSRSDFATLARQISGDPASSARGGDLGWLSRDRLPAGLGAAVFEMKPGRPLLLQSDIGWHLMEVTGSKGSQERSFEQAREEVVAAIEAAKRRQAVREFRAALRQFEHQRIKVFHDVLK